ncbi:MAG: signal peptidase I [Bacilli bacterium]|nr:signal peptidase I [Bacilli bacterium]
MKKKKNTGLKKFDSKSFTVSELEMELKREEYRSRYFKVLSSTIYALIIVASIAALVATLVMPVLQISGSSMTPTFHEGEIVFSVKTRNLKQGDIIAFYHGNKILVKRIIAGAGSFVNITIDGDVYVNGILLEEDYVKDKMLGDTNITYPYQVPDGEWFVLGDKRETSIDSRNSEIGCISQEDIVGKIIFRVWPFKRFGKINK